MTTEALVPAAAEPAIAPSGAGEIVLPQVIVDAGPSAVARFLEFFAGRIVEGVPRGGVPRRLRQADDVHGASPSPTTTPAIRW